MTGGTPAGGASPRPNQARPPVHARATGEHTHAH